MRDRRDLFELIPSHLTHAQEVEYLSCVALKEFEMGPIFLHFNMGVTTLEEILGKPQEGAPKNYKEFFKGLGDHNYKEVFKGLVEYARRNPEGDFENTIATLQMLIKNQRFTRLVSYSAMVPIFPGFGMRDL